MRTLMLTLLTSGVLALVWRGRRLRPASERRDWLADALRALSRAHDPRALSAALTHHLETGVDAAHVEWWRRDDDGAYHSRLGRIGDAEASVLDLWVTAGETWQRSVTTATCSSADAARILAATGAALVVPLRSRERPSGLLAVSAPRARESGGAGRSHDVAAYDGHQVRHIEALADHLVLVADHIQMTARLDESQRMLQQATRLSTVGTLAAELAHEIRNPLVAVQTFLQILPERLDDPEVTVDLRGVALTELQRVARLLNELLGMARASVATFAATDLEVVVEQVVRLLQVSARKKEVVLERAGDRLPTGAADASRLKQALVNLVLNAIQASPPGKTVVVTTGCSADVAGRPIVEIAVGDEGPGIPDGERETIFHPFFTTKENGTGLGLPVTRQIVADHGGSIVVDGEAGQGATFVVRLPLTLTPTERRDQAA